VPWCAEKERERERGGGREREREGERDTQHACDRCLCTGSPSGPGVVVDLGSMPHDAKQAVAISLHKALSTAVAAKPNSTEGVLPNVHGSEFFLIKVQTPALSKEHPILIYDKARPFTLPVGKEQGDAHKGLAAAVAASRNPVPKAYVWAKR
jgi:hypothetical protein